MRLTVKNAKEFNNKKWYQVPFDDELNAIDKLGQLEDIEDEYGIDLITLFKALSCGAYLKDKNGVLDFNECKLLYKRIQIGNTVHWLSNYGKTWALTKEELK